MQLETISYEVKGNIGRLTLNRPQARNAIGLQMAKELLAAAIECANDSKIRVLVLGAAGDNFSVGGDVKEFYSIPPEKLPAHLSEITAYLHPAMATLSHVGVPMVAGVQGFAAGAGMGFACLSDILLCGESSKFTMAYSGIGLVPDAGVSYILPRLIGMRKTLDLAMTNRVVAAQEAKEIGLVTQIVPDKELAAKVDELADQMAAKPTLALAKTREMLHRSWYGTMESQLDIERRTMTDMCSTHDGVEGIRAFIEKRKADFQGK